jgi:hypothetical protein
MYLFFFNLWNMVIMITTPTSKIVHNTTATIFTSVGWSFGVCVSSSSKPKAQEQSHHAVSTTVQQKYIKLFAVTMGSVDHSF